MWWAMPTLPVKAINFAVGESITERKCRVGIAHLKTLELKINIAELIGYIYVIQTNKEEDLWPY